MNCEQAIEQSPIGVAVESGGNLCVKRGGDYGYLRRRAAIGFMLVRAAPPSGDDWQPVDVLESPPAGDETVRKLKSWIYELEAQLADLRDKLRAAPNGDDRQPVGVLHSGALTQPAADVKVAGELSRELESAQGRIAELEAELARYKSGAAFVGEELPKGELLGRHSCHWVQVTQAAASLTLTCETPEQQQTYHGWKRYRYTGPFKAPLPESTAAPLPESSDNRQTDGANRQAACNEMSADKSRQNLTNEQVATNDESGNCAPTPPADYAAEWEALKKDCEDAGFAAVRENDYGAGKVWAAMKLVCHLAAKQAKGGE